MKTISTKYSCTQWGLSFFGFFILTSQISCTDTSNKSKLERYNIVYIMTDDHTSVFDSSQQTMPRLQKAAGYETATMIGKWHLESLSTGFTFWKTERY